MKIALVWPFDKAKWIWPNYRDGVRAAVEVMIRRGHEVDWYLNEYPVEHYDAIIIWDDSNTQALNRVHGLADKYALILTTELGLNPGNLLGFDVVFCEALPVYEEVRARGIRAVHAFGTDTSFYNPDAVTYREDQKINWEAFYPATFSPWKRQNIFSKMYKDRGLLLGTVQPDGLVILDECIAYRTNIMLGYYPAEFIREMYLSSEKVHITGFEGSGRTVIEALSMDIPVEVAEDNIKCQSYVQEWKKSGLDPRKFVLRNYSEEIYADKILHVLND